MGIPQDLTESLLSAAGDVAYEWNLFTDSISWYGPWVKIFGENAPPQDSQSLYRVVHQEDRHIVFNGEGTATIDRKFRLSTENNTILWVHERGKISEQDGKQDCVRGIWRIIDPPITNLDPIEAQNRDSLTGCYKRRYIQLQAAKVIDASRVARRPSAYMVVSVDKMSFVNEAIGTDAGDSVLRGVATRLSQLIPTRAVLGRVSGDVFGIILPEPFGNELEPLAERIINDFRNSPVIAAHVPIHITVSVGGARMPSVAGTSNEAMIFAEQALHMARQRGRNVFVEYIDSPERAQENRQILELGERIKFAFKNDGFRLAYQPIVSAENGQPVMYEALVRMFDPDGKPISAAAFVPMIEQMGLAVELDRLVMGMAIRAMTDNPHLSLAVNVSGVTASHYDWSEHLLSVLGPCPEVAKRMIVEITETAAIADIAETKRFIKTFRELGGKLSMDDFGAGATSLRYLRELDLAIMKIDKDLMKDVTTNREQQHLVAILIELAHGLGIKTVAEGIENEETAACLRKMKVDYLQGYYFGKPSLDMPKEPCLVEMEAPVSILMPSRAE